MLLVELKGHFKIGHISTSSKIYMCNLNLTYVWISGDTIQNGYTVIQYNYVINWNLQSPLNRAYPSEVQLHPQARFELNTTGSFQVHFAERECDNDSNHVYHYS